MGLQGIVECRAGTTGSWWTVAVIAFRDSAFRTVLTHRAASGWPADVGADAAFRRDEGLAVHGCVWCPLDPFVTLLSVDPDASRFQPFATAVFMRALEREGCETRILFYEGD